jgi:hypothetical protein
MSEPAIVVNRYVGNQVRATKEYQIDAMNMATNGYFPVSQSWSRGEWGAGNFFVAFLLCFILVGLLVFLYMLIVTPDGTLTVSFELRAPSKAP